MAFLGLVYFRALLFKAAVWALSGVLAFASITFDYPALSGSHVETLIISLGVPLTAQPP